MSKKIISVILCLALLLTAFSTVLSASATTGSLVLKISGVKISVQGQTCSVTVAVTQNTGIKSLRLNLNYDAAVLTLTGVSNGAILPGTTLVKSDMTAVPYVLYWMDAGNGSSATTGTLVTLNFTYKASFKSTDITVSSSEAKDINGNLVTVTATNDTATLAFNDYIGLITNVFNKINDANVFTEIGNSFTSTFNFFKSIYNFIMGVVDLTKVL
ncbi:MAG: cohesin domain-containing protein [Eubacteriales bacterium]